MDIAPHEFRRVMSNFPTGLTAITTTHAGQATGMVVGSFVSASLDPPLVTFFVGKQSRTWPKIQAAGRFLVNALTDAHEEVSRALARSGDHKFSGIAWHYSRSQLPVISGAAATLECELGSVVEVGDHWLVVGQVVRMERASESVLPLVYFQSEYHTIASESA